MMKNRSTAVQASTIAKVVALSIFLGGSGVGYVFQKSQIYGLSHQSEANIEIIHELEQRRVAIKFRLEQATSREQLELSARLFRLPLQEPPRSRIITLTEPRIEPARPMSLATQE